MVTIKFSTANEAFDYPAEEIIRILQELTAKLGHDGVADHQEIKLRDANGNTIGTFKYTDK